jgi:vanillate O-demethylase monooxygenase subunit
VVFLRNSWTVVAQPHEVTRFKPLARTVMGERIVMFRDQGGTAVALQDRCPHRFAPLSVGRVVGDTIRCGYHGMTFDARGQCVGNPTQPAEKIPSNARVRAYPVVERHGLLWIWPGDPRAADPSSIPNFAMFGDPAWSAGVSQLVVAANYLLLLDNLLDLSHINFVHGDVLGDPSVTEQPSIATEVHDRGLTEKRVNPSGPAVPAWRAVVADPWIADAVDFWMDMHWHAGSSLLLDVGVTPAGAPREDGRGIHALHCLLPESETTTRYFFGVAQNYRRDDTSIVSFWNQASTYAFLQDKAICEAVQSNMGENWDVLRMSPVVNKADRAALIARRVLRRLIAAETGLPEDARGVAERAAEVN